MESCNLIFQAFELQKLYYKNKKNNLKKNTYMVLQSVRIIIMKKYINTSIQIVVKRLI